MTASYIRIEDYEDAHVCAALAAEHGMEVALITPENGGGYGGPRYWRCLLEHLQREFPTARIRLAVDCGKEAGTVLKALEQGLREIVTEIGEPARARLEAIASQQGARLLRLSETPLELPRWASEQEKKAVCERWLGAAKHQTESTFSTEELHAY